MSQSNVTLAQIKLLENRLHKGWAMCDQAEGDDKLALEQFWIGLLREYERLCKAYMEQTGRVF